MRLSFSPNGLCKVVIFYLTFVPTCRFNRSTPVLLRISSRPVSFRHSQALTVDWYSSPFPATLMVRIPISSFSPFFVFGVGNGSKVISNRKSVRLPRTNDVFAPCMDLDHVRALNYSRQDVHLKVSREVIVYKSYNFRTILLYYVVINAAYSC